jgi:tetraacyldisaccharide 4'-kinase
MKNLSTPWWAQILRGERQGFWADSLRSIARLGSLGYGAGVRSRDLAYNQGWLKTRKLPQPTICVGNITAGGTGKTPLVIKLCRDLQARGLKPAVLLRGYKRKRHAASPILVRDAKGIRAGVDESGDEAMELADRLPGVLIGVGANRYAVGQFLLEHGAIDCFVLDDGFQHHSLARDINIITLDVTDPWGGGQLLPAGLLREPPAALRRADAVVLTRTALVGPDRLNTLRSEVSQKLAPGSCLLESVHEPENLHVLKSGDFIPLKNLEGQSVLVVSGIGNPDAFLSTVRNLGAKIEKQYLAADHSHDAISVWRWIERHWKPGMMVLMTEKDAMRWGHPKNPPKAFAYAYALRMNLVISRGVEPWEKLMNVIGALCHDR